MSSSRTTSKISTTSRTSSSHHIILLFFIIILIIVIIYKYTTSKSTFKNRRSVPSIYYDGNIYGISGSTGNPNILYAEFNKDQNPYNTFKMNNPYNNYLQFNQNEKKDLSEDIINCLDCVKIS